MQYLIRIPDLSMHDERACHASGARCDVARYRTSWQTANPVVQTLTDELEAATYVKRRFPDMFPMPIPISFADTKEDHFAIVCMENMDAVRLMQMKKGGVNPVCYVEFVPENRDERKRIKKRSNLVSKPVWLGGFVPPLETVIFQRKAIVRTSLHVGSSEQEVQVGRNRDGAIELQIPGTISIELSAELAAQIGKLSE